MTRKTTSPVMPTLLCRKWRMTCWRWLRALTVNSRSTPPPGGRPGSAGTASVVAWVVVIAFLSLACLSLARPSGQPDPRIEDRVEDVGEQVEQDDEDGADHEPAEDHVDVVLPDAVVEQVLAHPVPDEHPLGDDRPAEERGDAQRDDGGQRDERVAQAVPQDGAPVGQALGARQPHVVRAEDVEHRRTLEPAPGGKRQHRQPDG